MKSRAGDRRRLVTVLVASLALLQFGQPTFGQEVRYFQIRSQGCQGMRPLDFRALLDSTGGVGGRVVVRAAIDSEGRVINAHTLYEAERSGPDRFWRAVEEAIRTWCFSAGAVVGTTQLDYLVVVHPAREGGGGYVEINAHNLALRPGWTLNANRPAYLARVRNLDEGNVILTEAPPQFSAGEPTGFFAGAMRIWHQLGYAFQAIFTALFVALILAVVGVGAAGARSWVRPPLWARVFKRSEDVVHDDKKWPEDFGSKDAYEIREQWEKAIRMSQLDPEAFPKDENSGQVTSSSNEWNTLYSQFCAPDGAGGMTAEELDRLRRLTWHIWCEDLIRKALNEAEKKKGIDLFDVFAAGLRNHLVNRNEWWSSQEIDRAVDRALGEKLSSRRSTLDALWAIGAVAPLVGLFGTVWGISRAFGKIQNIQEAQLRMAKLAGDINVALATTIVGLIIGILAFVAYYVYKDRIERDGAKVSRYFTNITNRA